MSTADAPWWAGLRWPQPPRHQRVGLRTLDESGWLLDGDDVADQLAQKRHLHESWRDDVVARVPGHDSAAAAVERVVTDWLRRHRPDALVAVTDADPLVRAALLVPEDLCVLAPTAAGWVLVAASVAFPSRWRLADKIGRPLTTIHSPVPHAEEIAGPTTTILDRLGAGDDRILGRRNDTLHADAALHQPVGVHRPGTEPADLWLRSEFQTLRRVPATDAVLFTIRTQQVLLVDAVAGLDRVAFAAHLRRLDAALTAYKAGDFDPRAVADWLDAG